MSNTIYVGNYPTYFDDDDIINIFADFDDIILLRSVRKNNKCYCFIMCNSEEQVLDICLTLDHTDVDGRTLIVRSSDEDLQELIDECNDEDQIKDEHEDLDSTKPKTESRLVNQIPTQRQPKTQSRLVVDPSNSSTPPALTRKNLAHFSHSGSYKSSNFDSASCVSFATNGRISPGSTTSRFSRTDRRGERFSFVSVVNFRNGTTVEELEELFSEFKPYKIIMKRPKSYSVDDEPTEAIICFFKRKHATDSILNLDNTSHKGRVLLVNEYNNPVLIEEIMNVHNIK